MQIRAWLKYTVYTLLITLIFLKEYVAGQLKTNFNETFRIDYFFITIIMLLNISIGLFLGLEHLISEIKKDGTWKINLPKITLMGLTSLYMSLTYFLGYSNNQFLQKILIYPIVTLSKYGMNFVPIFQLILGYAIITSFYKHNEKFEDSYNN